MPKIKVLTEEVIQQIAAGEVVERPSSVVKELIENALDAGAGRIEVDVQRAGLDLISVRDNGSGMTAEDAQLALTRHATSKLTTNEDLASISTFGFRGEALPSIAAVSEFELVTAVKGALSGVRITSSGSSTPQVSVSEAISGTWIFVRNLFFNTPARLKFLKSERTELKRIIEVITRLAIIRPDVSFRALRRGRELITTSGSGKRKEAVELVLGKNSIIPWIEIEAVDSLGQLSGYVAPAKFARGSRNFQTIAVNGRWVKCPLIVSAVEAAFKPYLVRSCFPLFFLELTIDPKLVDVNVHPAKLEIRLSRDKEIWQFVYHTIKSALRPRTQLVSGSFVAEEKINTGTSVNPATLIPQMVKETAASYPATVETAKTCSLGETQKSTGGQQLALPISNSSWPRLNYIGQALKTYIIADNGQEIFLLDQHTVHERILYERIGESWKQEEVPLQHLLVPQTFTVTDRELGRWKEKRDLWTKIGLGLEEFGLDTLILRSVPQIMSLQAATTLVKELLSDDQDNQGSLAWEQERLHLQATVACHAALKAGQNLTTQEAMKLLVELGQCQHPFNCPHGRPTLICISRRELDRRFLRRLT